MTTLSDVPDVIARELIAALSKAEATVGPPHSTLYGNAARVIVALLDERRRAWPEDPGADPGPLPITDDEDDDAGNKSA